MIIDFILIASMLISILSVKEAPTTDYSSNNNNEEGNAQEKEDKINFYEKYRKCFGIEKMIRYLIRNLIYKFSFVYFDKY